MRRSLPAAAMLLGLGCIGGSPADDTEDSDVPDELGCTPIEVEGFRFLERGTYPGTTADPGEPYALFGGRVRPALDGDAPDVLRIVLSGDAVRYGATGTYAARRSPACGEVCVGVGVDEDPVATRVFHPTRGTVRITGHTEWNLEGSLEGLRFVELLRLNPATGQHEPVSDGACLRLAEFPFATTPPVVGWTCDPASYADGQRCHCRCGAPDPDCATLPSPAESCEPWQVCSDDGTTCEGPTSLWTCDAARYGSGDGCDCDCGDVDPDCGTSRATSTDCGADEVCGVDGSCIPALWTCEDDRHDESEYAFHACDCACGAPDPDCDDPELEVLGCELGQTCDAGVCVSPT